MVFIRCRWRAVWQLVVARYAEEATTAIEAYKKTGAIRAGAAAHLALGTFEHFAADTNEVLLQFLRTHLSAAVRMHAPRGDATPLVSNQRTSDVAPAAASKAAATAAAAASNFAAGASSGSSRCVIAAKQISDLVGFRVSRAPACVGPFAAVLMNMPLLL